MSNFMEGSPSDTFLDSFNKGLAFAHQAEQQNQVNQAQQMAARLHYMQSLKIADDLIQKDMINHPDAPEYKQITDTVKAKYGKDYFELRRAGISHDDIVKTEQAKNLTLENELVNRVRKGEITLKEALQLKNSKEGSPYKVGQILPSRDSGNQHITQQVTGFDEQGMPILKTIDTAPRKLEGNTPEKNETKDTLTQLQTYIDKNYTPEIKKLEKDDPTNPKLQELYDARQQTIDVMNQVRNKTLAPDKIDWGKGKQKQSQSINIDQEKQWALEAIKAGKDRKTVSENFKKRTGKNLY
jgi:hypothetical protein